MAEDPASRALGDDPDEAVTDGRQRRRLDNRRRLFQAFLALVNEGVVSPTAQDLAKGRTTEIDYLNGYVARESQALGLSAPVNRMLNALVKLREK